MAYSFKNNIAQKKLTQSKLKLTHPTQIKLTLKLDSNASHCSGLKTLESSYKTSSMNELAHNHPKLRHSNELSGGVLPMNSLQESSPVI